MEYKFYGWEHADMAPADEKYKSIKDPRALYDLLSEIWCADTCAPRMRDGWTAENKTLGQCSITAFLVQDIFGGKVYGILRSGGNYHCYNVIGDRAFDLTSEQFGSEVLDYENNPEQFREVHFAKEEKRLRYEYLKAELEKILPDRKNQIRSLLIKDTTKEERIQIVKQGLSQCGGACDFCNGCDNLGGGSVDAFYQPYIDGEKELRELNMEYRSNSGTVR